VSANANTSGRTRNITVGSIYTTVWKSPKRGRTKRPPSKSLPSFSKRRTRAFGREYPTLSGSQGGGHVSRSRLHRPMARSRNTQAKRTSKRLYGPIFMRNASTWPSRPPCVQAPYEGPSDTMPSAKLLTRSWKGHTYIHRTLIRPPRKSYKNVWPSDCRSPSLW
jgi:hypothetical protein